MTQYPDQKPAVYFTIGNNRPSGGSKVVNEFVQLCLAHGHHSRLCLPKDECQTATFVARPAPIMPVEELPDISTDNDIIVSCWHSHAEDAAFRESAAKLKVFWQHGILIPVGEQNVGEATFNDPCFDRYWNVSKTCAEYISGKYGIDSYSLVQPFFETPPEYAPSESRSGVLVIARRGSDMIPRIVDSARKYGTQVTVIRGPFDDAYLIEQLKTHRFFVSVDNGVKFKPSNMSVIRHFLYSIKLRLSGTKRAMLPTKKWVAHEENHLGFPVSAAQAASEGCVVIGFAMGGGLEWMTPENIYLARDDDADDLNNCLNRALSDKEEAITSKQNRAFEAIRTFSKDQAWSQLSDATDGLLN